MNYPKKWRDVTLENLQEMADYWKPLLGISDWGIDICIINQIDASDSGMAECEWLLSRRLAWIRYSDPATRSASSIQDDAEETLVHELLHVAMAAWHDYSDLNGDGHMAPLEIRVCCEQPIDQLAQTLVRLRRSGGHQHSFEQGAEQ